MPVSPLINQLAALTREHPTARKVLVAPDINWGREVLLSLARHAGGWIGWETTTLRSLAGELALVSLEEAGTRIAADVETDALIDRALARAVELNEVSMKFAMLAQGLGFRKVVRDAVLELRVAGVSPDALRRGTHAETPAGDLAPVFERYERLLRKHRLADSAAVFRAALAAFDEEAPLVLSGVVVIAQGIRERGLAGALAERLGRKAIGGAAETGGAGGAIRLSDPESRWGDDHDLSLFAAATPADEIREVLRRALALGVPWDHVEIVATDPDVYGVALDAIADQCGIGYTLLSGLPLMRTRVGRALDRWFGWLADGLPSDTLREAIEAGDLALPDTDPGIAPTELTRMFRSLRIGWGRERYESALAELRHPDFPRRRGPGDDESEEAFAERVGRRSQVAAALGNLLERLLATTPPVTERHSMAGARASVRQLADAAIGRLELFPLHGGAEQRTVARLRGRLQQMARLDGDEVPFESALAELQDGLADLRAWTRSDDDPKPWASSGGTVHMTDVRHGGTTGRQVVFVVGLDADRVAGPRIQDPLLPDAVRRSLDPANLPTTAVRREEHAADLRAMLRRVRGTVTLSCALSDEGGRAAGPGHVLLEALRILRDDSSLTYEDLRAHLGSPACAVPGPAVVALDARDVWLDVLAEGSLLLDGSAQVRQSFPLLAAGLASMQLRKESRLTPHHGLITAASGAFDPRGGGRAVSATSLELLAKCPMAWFYRYGLELRPPDDPEYDPEEWLDPMERGLLLHSLFEQFTGSYAGKQGALHEAAAEAAILEIADALLDDWRARVPPPSEAVYQSEAAEIRQSAVAFLDSEREAVANGTAGRWMHFELRFGGKEPVHLPIAGRPLPVYGFIDRVDALPDGTLCVIDYKTGKPSYYRQQPKLGPFNAGRNLQAAVYAAGAQATLGSTVSQFEYRFPTVRGESASVVYGPVEFGVAGAIIEQLLGHTERGEFIPTTDCNDCRYCDFGPVCRVSVDAYNKVSSTRAEWAAKNGSDLPEYSTMMARRSAP